MIRSTPLIPLILALACATQDAEKRDTAALDDVSTTGSSTTGTSTATPSPSSETGDTGTASTTPTGTTGTTSTATTTSTSTGTSSTTSTTMTLTGGTTTLPPLPLGPDDDIARAGCALFLEGARDALTAATDRDDAAHVMIQPDPALGHDLNLPALGEGYLTLAVGGWETTQAFFTLTGNRIEHWVPDGMVAEPLMLNGSCPDEGLSDQRIFFHHWTDVTLSYSDDGPRETWLGVVQVSP